MRRLHAVFIVIAIMALFAFGTVSYSMSTVHALSPQGACWQDNCDGSWPAQVKCGTPFRAQSDVNIVDYNTGVTVGQLRMWKTGASGGGCMDTWATFAGNGNEAGNYIVQVAITRSEYIHGDGDGKVFSENYTGGNGNHDTQNVGYEGHQEDCFQANMSIGSGGNLYFYSDNNICPT